MGEADTGEPISEWRRGLQADVPCAVWLLAAAKKRGPFRTLKIFCLGLMARVPFESLQTLTTIPPHSGIFSMS